MRFNDFPASISNQEYKVLAAKQKLEAVNREIHEISLELAYIIHGSDGFKNAQHRDTAISRSLAMSPEYAKALKKKLKAEQEVERANISLRHVLNSFQVAKIEEPRRDLGYELYSDGT